MHIETTCTAIVDQQKFQSNFERWNGLSLSTSSLTRRRMLITYIGGLWSACQVSNLLDCGNDQSREEQEIISDTEGWSSLLFSD